MKKLFILCVSIIVLSFTGCSTSVDSGSSPTATAANIESTNSSNLGDNAGNTAAPSISSTETENKTNQKTAEQSKQEFLDSSDGHSFQITAYRFAKAFFEKDTKVIKSYLINPEKGFNEYSLGYSFKNVEFMILKLNSGDIKKDSVSAQYEFKTDSEDNYTYLQLSLKKVNDKWKIDSYGLEK